MTKKTNFAIGCLVQWYEVEIIEEYLNSVKSAIDCYDGEVITDITIISNTTLEKPVDNISLESIIDNIKSKVNKYGFNFRIEDSLHTIADYRRQFNDMYCDKVDVLIWGESDMLAPKQMFIVLDSLHRQVHDNTPKYLAFFSTCKMWDESWKPLEHVDFTDKPFLSGPEHTDKWWSHWYTMNQKELDDINSNVSELQVNVLPNHKFNGCGLIISSEIIRSGVNIPRSVFFVHEDTAFMQMTNKVLHNIPQFIIKNILLVHNRKHPKKRMYVKNEDENLQVQDRRETNDWYKKSHHMCQLNCYNLFNPNYKSYKWEDVFNEEIK